MKARRLPLWAGLLLAALVLGGLAGLAVFYARLPQHLNQHETLVLGQSRWAPGSEALVRVRDAMHETQRFGFEAARRAQSRLGEEVRAMLARKGYPSVAAPGFEAPGVVVSYTEDEAVQSGRKLLDAGLQIAAGVPLAVDEPADFRTFRIGLFGLDKLANVDRTVSTLAQAFDRL